MQMMQLKMRANNQRDFTNEAAIVENNLSLRQHHGSRWCDRGSVSRMQVHEMQWMNYMLLCIQGAVVEGHGRRSYTDQLPLLLTGTGLHSAPLNSIAGALPPCRTMK